jgi:hypothetical protein
MSRQAAKSRAKYEQDDDDDDFTVGSEEEEDDEDLHDAGETVWLSCASVERLVAIRWTVSSISALCYFSYALS